MLVAFVVCAILLYFIYNILYEYVLTILVNLLTLILVLSIFQFLPEKYLEILAS